LTNKRNSQGFDDKPESGKVWESSLITDNAPKSRIAHFGEGESVLGNGWMLGGKPKGSWKAHESGVKGN
jgi:hypothetical protein